jgi:hypothetical protein
VEKKAAAGVFEARPARRGKPLKHWRLGLLEKEATRVLKDWPAYSQLKGQF